MLVFLHLHCLTKLKPGIRDFTTKRPEKSISFFYLTSLCSNGWLPSSGKQNLLVMEGMVQAMGERKRKKKKVSNK